MSKIKNSHSLKYYMNLPYTISMIPEEAGGYFVEIEELPGCMSQGETREEALDNIEDAKRMWLESMLQKGQPIPEPEATREFSGKFLVRIPASLHRRIANLAKKEGVSLNQYVLHLLSDRTTTNELRLEITRALWEIETVTQAKYDVQQGSMVIADSDAVYDALSDKSRIPRMSWQKSPTRRPHEA